MAHVSLTSAFKSLRLQLILLIFLPLTLLGAAVVWMTYQAVEGLVEHRLQKEIELVARTMRVPVEQALQANDLDSIEKTLDAVFEIGRVYGAYVYDTGGRRVAVAGEARPGHRDQVEAAELVELGEELGRYAELGGEEVFSYFVPLTGAAGRIEGLLQVVRLERDIAAQLDEIRTRVWLTWSAITGIVLVILLIGHRLSVGRHVERLEGSMARIESGDRTHRARMGGPTELAGVAGAFNRMLDGLDRMESELSTQRRERLRMAQQMHAQDHLATLGRFSTGVAHELGAPLTVIDGDTRRLQQVDKLDGDTRRRLKRIRDQIRRTRELISQLMGFARSDRQKQNPISLAPLLDRALASVRLEYEAHGISLDVEEVPDRVVVSGWEVRLEHALINLLRNAAEAADSKVVVSCEDCGDRIRIMVEDDGPGVPDVERRRIFEPFYTSGKGRHGTGLGLAIVKGVAAEHGGQIRVDSSQALGGSRFELILRAARA